MILRRHGTCLPVCTGVLLVGEGCCFRKGCLHSVHPPRPHIKCTVWLPCVGRLHANTPSYVGQPPHCRAAMRENCDPFLYSYLAYLRGAACESAWSGTGCPCRQGYLGTTLGTTLSPPGAVAISPARSQLVHHENICTHFFPVSEPRPAVAAAGAAADASHTASGLSAVDTSHTVAVVAAVDASHTAGDQVQLRVSGYV
jgi:hypothetical protein